MTIGGLLKGLLALGVPRMAKDAAGNDVGMLTPSGAPFPSAIVYAFPSTPQVYTSPIAGEPDLVNSFNMAGLITNMGTGFLQPKAGILTDIGIVTQGNTGDGTAVGVRWAVATIKNDPAAPCGIAVDEVLDTGVTNIANNFNGKALLATGKTLAVPSQFMVFMKPSVTGSALNVQLMNSAGPLPGVVGNADSTLVSAATYSTTIFDVATPATGPVADDPIRTLSYKGIAVYIKWKGQ